MKKSILLSAMALVGLSVSACAVEVSETAPAPLSSAQRHVDKAYALAGDSFMQTTVDLQCTDKVNAMSFFKNAYVPPPTKVFDNLYFAGISSVSAFALQTTDGIILIDALNNSDEAKNVLEAGLIELGLNPADIKFIIVTHGHGDHYGGANYFVEKYGAQVLMTEKDWELALSPRMPPKIEGLKPPKWSKAPAKDKVAVDGQALVLGDTTVNIITTPGHTAGTLSLIFPVFNHGEKHIASLWGGTGFPRDLDGINQYVASAEKFLKASAEQGVDVALSNHMFVDDSLQRMAVLRENPEINPFIIGTDAVRRYKQILAECGKAAAAKLSSGV